MGALLVTVYPYNDAYDDDDAVSVHLRPLAHLGHNYEIKVKKRQFLFSVRDFLCKKWRIKSTGKCIKKRCFRSIIFGAIEDGGNSLGGQ